MKKIVVFILVFSLCFSALSFGAGAQGDYVSYPVSGGNIYFDPDTGMVVDSDPGITYANIPAWIDGVTVTGIGSNAFDNCFMLNGVALPYTVTYIGDYAFAYCMGLSSVNIPYGVTTIGAYAFSSDVSLKSIALPNTVTKLGRGAFDGCMELSSLTLSNSLTSIEEATFNMCGRLTYLSLPAGITSIGRLAFASCGMKNLKLPDGLSYIGEQAFMGAKLESINIPAGVKSIEKGAFQSCENLRSISLPEGLTNIGESAFQHCVALKEISLPQSLSRVVYRAFSGCSALAKVNYAGSPRMWSNVIIEGENEPLKSAVLGCALENGEEDFFSDVSEKDWFCNAVYSTACAGLVAGKPDGSFAPLEELSWAQTVTFAVRVDQYKKGTHVYGAADQTGEHWYDIYVSYALENGIIDVSAENPNAIVTRGEAAVIFAAVLGYFEPVNFLPAGYFTDVPAEGQVQEAIYKLAYAGICNGKGERYFGTDETFKRSEVATIVARMTGLAELIIIEN